MNSFKASLNSFKDLKTVLDRHKAVLNEKSMTDDRPDEEIFLEAMADVKEIREFREIPVGKPQRIKIAAGQKDNTPEILRQIIRRECKIRLADTGEYVEWISPIARKDLARKLHYGRFSVQDYIDLHGMTLDGAEDALRTFLMEARRKRLFCVKVIHGRGLRSPNGPVLKEATQRWLKGPFRKWVLAYSTAKDCDGGLGAMYVLLK
ncbi:MAG: Smr/MutS family protein [Nitrospirota bacterium]